jgi:hypothetical protein
MLSNRKNIYYHVNLYKCYQMEEIIYYPLNFYKCYQIEKLYTIP